METNQVETNKDYIKMSMVGLINILLERNWSKPQIAKVLGVTPLQVTNYALGRTTKPKPTVCYNIYHNIRVGDRPILIEHYHSYEDLTSHLQIYKKVEAMKRKEKVNDNTVQG